MKNLLRIITNNWPYKLLSIAIAIGIWYFVATQNDPIETESYQIHITVENESYIANGKQVYMIDDSNKVVTVYLKGNRSVLKNIKESDITVTADLTQIVDLEKDPVMVPLSASCTRLDTKNITLSKNTIPIVIENVSTKELPVTVITNEVSADSDYEIGALTPQMDSITVSGPESIINNIDSVAAQISVTGLTQSSDVKGKLIFIDKSQNEISDETIRDDIKIEGDVSDISVYVEIWKKMSGVGFKTGYTGTPAEGYVVSSIATTPENITVAGTEKALEQITADENKITIPDEFIDVSGQSNDMSIDVSLSDILPEDTKPASSTSDNVRIKVTILPKDSTEISLDVDDISINNLQNGLAVAYVSQNLNIKVQALNADIADLTTDSIKASIDLKDFKDGDYTVPVKITLAEGYGLVEDVNVRIRIKSS